MSPHEQPSQPAPDASSYGLSTVLARFGWVLPAAVFAALSIRLWLFINRYAVNVLFWDQWDFYNPLFSEGGLWSLFDYQHGPHRQGIGFLLTAVLAKLGAWDSRWDAFAVGFTLMAACLVALALARKCGVTSWRLAVVPLLFLNLRQYEMFVNASNVSHGAMPMLLFMTLLLCWFIPRELPRLLAISLLAFFCIFTGFAVFVGVVVPAVLAVLLVQAALNREWSRCSLQALALGLVGFSWFLFSRNYHFNPAVDGYRFPYEKPQEYLYFTAAMLNNFHGYRTESLVSLLGGIAGTGVLVALAIRHGWRILTGTGDEPVRDIVIFSLSAFVLIYCANTAVGRVFLGWKDAAAASRYVTLLAPAGLAALIFASNLKSESCRSMLIGAYALFLAYSTVALHTSDMKIVRSFSDGRKAWRAAFQATGDQVKADAISHFQVYPCPIPEEKIEYLRAHRLNVFKPEPAR